MFDNLSRLFSRNETQISGHDPRMAVAALLVHLAAVDGTVSEAEKKTIRLALKDHYDLDGAEVDKLVAEATRRDADAVDFYQFTSALSRLEADERVQIIRMMWQVVFADKANHELEDNMVWRVAELIGVSARDRTILRKEIANSATGPAGEPA